MLIHRAFLGAASLLALNALSACIYTNVNRPLAYRSPTLSDVHDKESVAGRFAGRACSHVILGLVAWGDGGYAKALEIARTEAAANTLVDVTADYSSFNILGVYQRGCTELTGRALREAAPTLAPRASTHAIEKDPLEKDSPKGR